MNQNAKKQFKKKQFATMRVIQRVLYTCTFLVIFFLLILGGLSTLNRKKEAQHTPVTIEDLKVSTKQLEEKIYDVSYTTDKMIDGVQYYKVTIGDVETIMPASEYNEKFKSNDKITTSIYIFTAQNTQNYMFKKSTGDTVQAVRFSYLNEGMFNEEETAELTNWAAKTLTDVKYEALGYEKAELPSFFTLKGAWF